MGKNSDTGVVLNIRSMLLAPRFFCILVYMDTSDLDSNSNVGDGAVNYQIRRKWGNAVGKGGLTGYLALPEVLLRGQHRLGLTSTEMMVLINVLLHWWYAEKMPFPSNHKIAKRMGVDTRTVQRACKNLEKKKLIDRKVKILHDKDTNSYSSTRTIELGKLVSRLNEIAVDLGKFSRSTRANRSASGQP